jgi:hypothetical protein
MWSWLSSVQPYLGRLWHYPSYITWSFSFNSRTLTSVRFICSRREEIQFCMSGNWALLLTGKISSDLGVLCRLIATPFTISSYSFIEHYMFRPNWPSSGVQVVMMLTVIRFSFLLLPLVILVKRITISFIWVSLGCTWLLFCNVWCTVSELSEGCRIYDVTSGFVWVAGCGNISDQSSLQEHFNLLFVFHSPGSKHRSFRVGFMVDNLAMRQVFSEYFGFLCQFSFN